MGEVIKIYIKLIVREDDMSFCGFVSREEFKMFELLIFVFKIGFKVVFLILLFVLLV